MLSVLPTLFGLLASLGVDVVQQRDRDVVRRDCGVL